MREIAFVCKLLAFSVFIIASAVTVSAQVRPRFVFDNFDTSNGVQIQSKPQVQLNKPVGTKKAAARTNSRANNVQLTSIQRPTSGVMLQMAAGKSLGNFTTGDAKVDGYIVDSCARHNIDPLLVYATMHQESSFKPKATSYKGARGLMQLMPATAARFGVTNIYDPQQNIEGGVKYLRWLLNTFKGDVKLTLAGYNAGEGAVMKYNYTIPPYNETQNYVKRITARYEQIRNPNYVRSVLNVPAPVATNKQTRKTIAAVPQTVVAPPPIYVPSASAVKLSNGKIQLSTQ